MATAINTRMAELDVTQAELAQRSGVSPATLRKLMRNYPDKSPSRRTLDDISKALRWPAGHLSHVLNGDDPAKLDSGSELDQLRAAVADLQDRVALVESELREGRAVE